MSGDRRAMEVPGERGSVSVFVAVLAVSFLMAAGLALDGARKLGGLSEARDLADNAARTCAQGIDEAAVRSSGTPLLDPDEASGRAADYLSSNRPAAGFAVDIDGVECIVEVTLTIETQFLPGPFVVSATEAADALSGVDGP